MYNINKSKVRQLQLTKVCDQQKCRYKEYKQTEDKQIDRRIGRQADRNIKGTVVARDEEGKRQTS